MDSCRIVFDPTCHGNMLFLSNRDTLFQGSGSLLNMDETTNKRPFFNSANDLMEEDFYDEQLPEKKRRLSPEQIELLERSFDAENKLEPERKSELARKLGMQPRQVAIWFQNRRARWKNKQLERDYDELKASFDALRRKYENLAKEKEQLKIEVISLTEKLQARDLDGIADSPPLTTEEIFIEENIKTEDRLSSGTGGSIIVDEDGLQIVDSGDSYFADDYCGGLGNVNAISEEDDGSDALTATENHHYEDEEDQNHLAWWFWS